MEPEAMNRKALELQLRSHEGYSLTPYLDTKKIWTTGIGHNIHHKKIGEFETVGELLDHYADPLRHELWFTEDVTTAIAESNEWIPHETLTEPRQRVLSEMFFVLGGPRARRFVKFKAAALAGDHGLAANEITDSLWGRSKARRRVFALAEQWAEG